jgi:DNA polymerase-3 subunit epsilon
VPVNKYADSCHYCGRGVPAGDGEIFRMSGQWATAHPACVPPVVAPRRGDHDGWHRQRLASFDLETTGPQPSQDRVVTAAICDTHAPTRTWLVDPGVDIPAEATAVHHVTTEHARADGTRPEQALTEIAAVLDGLAEQGVPVIVFRAAYDLTLLECDLSRHGLPALRQDLLVIDPFVLDRHLDTDRMGSRRLGDMCTHYGITLTGAHTADGDAGATLELAKAIAACYPEVAGMHLSELHQAQIRWHAEQASTLQRILRRKGSAEVVNADWPRERTASH